MEDDVEVGLRREVTIGGVEAALEILTADRCKPHPIDGRAGKRKRARASHGARQVSGREEPIPVGPVGGQAGDLDMDRVGERRARDPAPVLDDPTEGRVR